MNKLIITLLGRTAAILAFFALVLGLTFVAPAANSAATDKAPTVSKASATHKAAAKKPRAKYTCKKTPKSFTKNGVTVLNMKTCFDIRILKKMGCDTEAGKNEQPAPPRDPRSECKGKVKVHFKLKMKSPKPPAGMMCTEFDMSITIAQWLKAHGLSISIANGRVDTWARTHLTLKDVIKGWIKTSCIMIPSTVDVCPDIPGDQPEGTDCTPPPTYQAPTASGQAKACVYEGQNNGVITASGTNPNSVAAPGTLVVGGQKHDFASVAAGQTVPWDFTGYAPGTYQGSFSLGSPINKSVSFSVTVQPCPKPVHANPVGELNFGEHAVDLYGTMPVFGRVRATDGATPIMGTPQVTPNDLGTVSNWRVVSTNASGAACEAGWVCYMGTFRVTKSGTPGTYLYGTMVSHMSDSMGGSSYTDSKSFSVYYAKHPET